MTRARTDVELHVRALIRAARDHDDHKMARHCRLLAELASAEGRRALEADALALAQKVNQLPPLSSERGEALLKVAFEVAEARRCAHVRRRSRPGNCVIPPKDGEQA